ncbi:GNAT family N-acetyltransferase [Bdellovibrio sp. KM01]|uniref:GNAT family N-acetyltransferase n=1 Tax=Bdellovibrio sp. KM01 TaxID=2748865 RepID=UPI0015EA83D4|nr:GNAT family N-acetyltransferase [Bdellovibrio sp. KM01]QLY26888.1 GNAT family N-acetyltransferase [Bdellovibrio sp. KM01]
MQISTDVVQTKKNKTVILRSAHVSDAPGLRAVLTEIAEASPYILSTADDFRSRPENAELLWVEKYVSNPRDLLMFVEYENQVVGFMDFSCGTRNKTFHRGHLGMSVHPNLRGEGIGEQMLKKLFKEASSIQGLTQIELSVMHVNTPAIQLYKKMGFVECGRTPNAFKMQDGSFADQIGMYATV